MLNCTFLTVLISIHAPTRGATRLPAFCHLINIRFQSTLPQEERHWENGTIVIVEKFQSTLPQEERRLPAGLSSAPSGISIHAPTRGATDEEAEGDAEEAISIHAPTRGATFCLLIVIPVSAISIHAPTRGATRSAESRDTYWSFQSTLPQEERPNLMLYVANSTDFNPRSHKRSDRRCGEWGLRSDISIHAPTRGATIISPLL